MQTLRLAVLTSALIEPQNRCVSDEKPERRRVVARSLGAWIGYLRRQTKQKQAAVAETIGVSLDGVRRVERGENVGLELMLPFLSWLDGELAGQPKRHVEFVEGLVRHLVEAGADMRTATSKEDLSLSQPSPRAAAGEKRNGKIARAR